MPGICKPAHIAQEGANLQPRLGRFRFQPQWSVAPTATGIPPTLRPGCRRLLEPFTAPVSLVPSRLSPSAPRRTGIVGFSLSASLLRLVPSPNSSAAASLAGEFFAVRLSQVNFASYYVRCLPSYICSLVALEISRHCESAVKSAMPECALKKHSMFCVEKMGSDVASLMIEYGFTSGEEVAKICMVKGM